MTRDFSLAVGQFRRRGAVEQLFDFGFGLRDQCRPCVSRQRHALCVNEGHVVNAWKATAGSCADMVPT